ncbi:MAG: SpoIIE family protein phosphatase [Thermoanaerobaculia bacterium]|nr:SpoIIE family protein phosphatase [Thermoanaerobaculia bacterium]
MRSRTTSLLIAFGAIAFLLAALSIVDVLLPKPYDGVVLEADQPGRLIVDSVLPGSGADRAGIRPGEQIVGVDRNVLRSPTHAAEILNRHDIGESVPYLVRGSAGLREVAVELEPRRIGSLSYFFSCLLGVVFFFVGLFVLRRQPQVRAAQLFFVLSVLMMLFLVCRLRPASYSWIDSFVLTTGMVALLFLPASFLHFFLVFPKTVRLRPEPGGLAYRRRRRLWLTALTTIYLVPPLTLLATLTLARRSDSPLPLISGAPVANWWLMAIYMLLGLTALAANARRFTRYRERRAAALVFIGVLFGLLPFLVTIVLFPETLHQTSFLIFGLLPLTLVLVTFAYAIIRFQLLKIELRKSLLYTVTTAVVTALYALVIALFNLFTRGIPIADSPFFPLLFALAIVLLFEPLRKRIQVLVDRFYYAERTQLQAAIQRMSEAFSDRVDLQEVVTDLVDNLPQLVGLHFAALYLVRDDRLKRVAGPASLPDELPSLPVLHRELTLQRGLTRLVFLAPLARESEAVGELLTRLDRVGVRVVGDLATPRRRIGTVMLSGKIGQIRLDKAELDLLDSLLHQAAIALETSLLLEERTQQAELERELEIAAAVQQQLLPPALSLGPGWEVAALCRPARHIGGDFFTGLPTRTNGSQAVVYGDVAGKSVSGALLMMAAHEVLHSLALTHDDPAHLLGLANQRLHSLTRGRKSFVALAYLAATEDGYGVEYLLAGQPQPLLRTHDGLLDELTLPENRLPLGALVPYSYQTSRLRMESGDLLLGYSDGVVEAQSPSGQLYGLERLAAVVSEAPAEPNALVEAVMTDVERFTRGTEPYDDITLVAIRRHPEDSR